MRIKKNYVWDTENVHLDVLCMALFDLHRITYRIVNLWLQRRTTNSMSNHEPKEISEQSGICSSVLLAIERGGRRERHSTVVDLRTNDNDSKNKPKHYSTGLPSFRASLMRSVSNRKYSLVP